MHLQVKSLGRSYLAKSEVPGQVKMKPFVQDLFQIDDQHQTFSDRYLWGRWLVRVSQTSCRRRRKARSSLLLLGSMELGCVCTSRQWCSKSLSPKLTRAISIGTLSLSIWNKKIILDHFGSTWKNEKHNERKNQLQWYCQLSFYSHHFLTFLLYKFHVPQRYQ